jgi:site-specific recombinase XerD
MMRDMSDANELLAASYDRELRSKNRSDRTRQSYFEALAQIEDYHNGADLTTLIKADIQDYLNHVLGHHKASTAANRFRSLRAFYNWCVTEEIIDRSPMAGMEEPSIEDKPIPILDDAALKALLKACAGPGFRDRRDTVIIRIFCEPGSPRRSEMAGLLLDDIDMRRDLITVRGKGNKVRAFPFGVKTGQAIDRYLRVRAKHPDAKMPQLLLGFRRGVPLTGSGIKQMLERRAEEAGLGHIFPHQLRHTAAHNWADEGGSESDAMALFGWSSPDMPRVYGRSAQVDRAQRAARRMSQADRL